MPSPFHGFDLLLLAVSAIGVAFVILSAHFQPSSGAPRPVGWNCDLCAHCGMVVGDRHFAAQLETADGETLNFDDPGCLMAWVAGKRSTPRALYFRPFHGDGWLALDQVAFLPVAHSPAGFALAAVHRGTPGSIRWEQAVQQVRQTTRRAPVESFHARPYLVSRNNAS